MLKTETGNEPAGLATWTRPSWPTAPGCRRRCTPLGLTVSIPPTQAGMQALADKLDEVIARLPPAG